VLISDEVVFTEAALTTFLGASPVSTPVSAVPDTVADELTSTSDEDPAEEEEDS
jgi:hypothetical protein